MSRPQEVSLARLLRVYESKTASTSSAASPTSPTPTPTRAQPAQSDLSTDLAQDEEGDPSALPSAAPSDDWRRGGKARQHVEVMRGLVTEIRARDPTAADAYSKRVDRIHTALQLGNSSQASSSSPAYVTNGGASTSRQEWRPYKPPPAVVRRRAAAAASAAVTSPNANANVVGSSPSSRRGEGGVKISQSGDAHLRRQRETQEQLTDEMLELAGGIKANSLAMERSLLDSKRELDAVEGSLDKNLAGVKNERKRQKAIYETNRKGGCWTWIVLIAVGLVFTWVVLYMRFTHDRTRFKVR